MNRTFTVFTPTFNREATLVRLYESLCAQTFNDFEWVVVDDGSIDDTKQLIEDMAKKSWFPIKYLYQKNSGKYHAFNAGVNVAQGKLFLTVDSDDELLPNALNDLLDEWNKIPINIKDKYTGVCALMVDCDANVIGNKFPESPLDSNSHEVMYKYSVQGDKIGFHRLDVLKQYPYPAYVNCTFVPEGVVWARIGRNYQTRYVNIYAGIVHFDSGNRTTDKKPGENDNYLPFVDWYKEMINYDYKYFKHNYCMAIKAIFNYSRFSSKSGIRFTNQIKSINKIQFKVLFIMCYPLSKIYTIFYN